MTGVQVMHFVLPTSGGSIVVLVIFVVLVIVRTRCTMTITTVEDSR
jgi:hypothetical protein